MGSEATEYKTDHFIKSPETKSKGAVMADAFHGFDGRDTMPGATLRPER